MIKIEHVSKSFGNIKAVDDLSFEIQKGEVVGFLGPNGAGKTTTMRLITGFLSADSGTISVGNIDMGRNTIDGQKLIGYMPENNPLYKDMLVSEFLDFSADLNGIPKDKRGEAFDFAVKAVAIQNDFYRPISELSKGFKQRVGIACALLHQPQILILDEPTEGLDPNQRTEIRTLIKDLAKNRTIIMSTHVMQEAQAVCDRLIIISKGKLAADGTGAELSRAAENEKVLTLEIEGKNVENALKNLAGIEKTDFERLKNGRLAAKIYTKESIELRPDISRLAAANGWIIWNLGEKEFKLEDIFHKLTV